MTDKEYRDYVQDIIDSIKDIESFVGDMDFQGFVADKKTVNAAIRSIEVMGEAAKNIPQSIRDRYPDIPWKKMAGTRDKLIHEYSGVDLEIVWNLIKQELGALKPSVLRIMQELNKGI